MIKLLAGIGIMGIVFVVSMGIFSFSYLFATTIENSQVTECGDVNE